MPGILLVIAGIFSIIGAVQNWDWFFNSTRARLFVGLFGREGARLAYAIIGALLMVFGGLMAMSG